VGGDQSWVIIAFSAYSPEQAPDGRMSLTVAGRFSSASRRSWRPSKSVRAAIVGL
jgi:hypothetical protein